MRLTISAGTISLAIAMSLACTEEGNPAGGGGDSSAVRLETTPASIELAPGGSATVEVVAFDRNSAPVPGLTLVWTSTSTSVASVSSTGVVSAVAPGNATIRVSAGQASADVEVRVVPPDPQASAIEIHPAVEYQRISGWEGAGQIGQTECNQQAFAIYRLPLINRLVNELGINRIRMEVRAGHESTVDWYTMLLNGQPGWQEHRYDAVNDNSDPRVAQPGGFQFSELDHKVDVLITPMRAALAARGEDLYVNLTYVDFGASSFEHSSDPEEYAELIAETFKHFQARYGWVPDAVEIILEPNNTPNWRGATIGAALVATGERLAELGFRPAFIAPSTSSMSGAVPFLNDLLGVPGVRTWLTDLSYHRYSGVSASALTAIREHALANGLRTGMLEHIGSGYQDLHEDLKNGMVSSWQQFALAFCLTDRGGAYYVIDQSNPSAPVINLGSRSRYLRHYFSFIRMNAVRVGASSGDARFDPLAFRNTNGKLVVVVSATASGSVDIRGLPPGTYGVVRTTASSTFASGPDVAVSSGGEASFSMPAAGVMTIVQR